MKTKPYATSVRTPMMYGGSAKPTKKMYGGGATPSKKRKKMSTGGNAVSDADKKAVASAKANADLQSRVATGRTLSDKDKALVEKQRIEELGRMSIATLRKIASGPLSNKDTMLARKVLRDKGDKQAMPQSVDK